LLSLTRQCKREDCWGGSGGGTYVICLVLCLCKHIIILVCPKTLKFGLFGAYCYLIG
jgi:hypothetical protein